MVQSDRRDVLLSLGAGLTALAVPASRAVAETRMEPPAAGPLSAPEIEALLTEHKIPGACLAILDRGELNAVYSYGLAQTEMRRRVMPQTRFQAASISKTFNALAVLKLVEAGRLALDDAVNKHLKTWKLPDNALTAETPVTVRMLLSHTGGTTVPGFVGYDRNAPIPTLPQVLDGTPPANSPPVYVAWPPGKSFRYSGGGTSVLEQMVIDVTAEPYPAVMERLVLGPLGMRASSFGRPSDAQALDGIAFGHGIEGATIPGGFKVHPELAAAGLWTTARDLTRMIAAIIASRNGRPGSFLNTKLATEMLTPVASGSALGVFVNAEGVFTHLGGNVGFRAFHTGDPRTGSGAALMTNGDNGQKIFPALGQRVGQAYSWPWLLSSSPSP